MPKIRLLVMLCALSILFGCASVPREGSNLSAELGKRISAIEESHFHLLHKYMDIKRARIDEFIEKEWIPEFAKNYLSKPKISDKWKQIMNEGTAKDKLTYFTMVSAEAQLVISKKRLELIAPLDEAEKLIDRKLKNEYAQAKAMNSAITGLLASASEVEEAKGTMLNTFNIKEEHLAQLMVGVEKAVAGLSKVEESAEHVKNAANKFERFKSDINTVVDTLKNNK